MNPPPVPNHQKLVTIYLENTAYLGGSIFGNALAEKHGLVEEHLAPYLQQGWRIIHLHGFGGNSDGLAARGWILVVLEQKAAT
jgi:hypothetical protein